MTNIQSFCKFTTMSITRDTYLTIDLDYWMKHDTTTVQEMIDFLRIIKQCQREVHVVKYHHEIIPHISNFQNVTRLINLDYHSDIADVCIECRCERDFNEGTWVNFVHGIARKEYIWRFPFNNQVELSYGYCHEMVSPFTMTPSDRKSIGWGKVSMKQGLPTSRELLRCAAFGICVSPNWAPRNHNIAPAALLADLGFIQRKDVRKFSNDNSITYIEKLNKRLYKGLCA